MSKRFKPGFYSCKPIGPWLIPVVYFDGQRWNNVRLYGFESRRPRGVGERIPDICGICKGEISLNECRHVHPSHEE
jgi:hypothetical protein